MTPLAKKRKAAGDQQPMFLRLIWRGALVRRGRALAALLAVVVAAAVTTALLNLYVDAQAKLRTEFRSYGANVVVIAPEGSSLPSDALQKVERVIGARGAAVPVGYAVAKAASTNVVVVGTDMARARQMNQWWSITPLQQAAADSSAASALVGARALQALSPAHKPFTMTFAGREIAIVPAGVLKTGAAEDNRIYLDLTQFEAWTGLRPNTIEIAVSGAASGIDGTLRTLQQALPGADVRPVRQIVEGEARVLGKTRSALLASTALVIITAALCVLATLMSWVLDRRRDFAVMKALGASERLLKGLFAVEAGLIGALGALIGFGFGVGAAVWIGRANFHSAVVPRFSVLPEVLVGGVVVSLVAALVPISLLRGIQPAAMLRGE